jgi:PBSX family phage terminase large subunit
MYVEFDKKLFNPIYWHIDEALRNENIRMLLLYGGSSSSKTYSIAQWHLINAIEKLLNLFVLRKESVTVMNTVYKSFQEAAKPINDNIKFFDFLRFNIRCANSNSFVFSGIDDPEKIKGLESFHNVFLNELSKFAEADLDEIKRRLRGKSNQKIIADWNPIDETHWIKSNLIDFEDWVEQPLMIDGKPESKLNEPAKKWINSRGNIVLIKTTYRDNYWITGSPDGSYGFKDTHTIDNFEDMRRKKPNQYAVYANGEWGSFRVGGEFWKQFNIDRHVGKVEFIPDKNVHVTVDINRYPYIAQALWQYSDFKFTQFSEQCAKDPENTARKAALKVATYLERLGYSDVVFLYGDASGKNKSAMDNNSFFDVYIAELKKHFVVEDRIMKSNPSVSMSGTFINEIYEGNTPFSIMISDNCNLSKVDYNTVKEGANGEMVKEKITDANTGISYEKNGHLSDAKRYFIIKILEKEYKEFLEKRRKYVIL